jgi:D-alanyl-D-alanine carboxypeptidase
MQSEPNGSWWERTAGVTWGAAGRGNDGSGAVFPDGQQFHYSNLGYALLGEVVARVLDQPWIDAVRDRILEPLGLRRTSYQPEDRAAQGWSVDPYAGTLTAEPVTDTGAMAPRRAAVVHGRGPRAVRRLPRDRTPRRPRPVVAGATRPIRSGEQHAGLESGHGAGFQLIAWWVGHAGRPQRVDARVPRGLLRGPGTAHRVCPPCNATTGVFPDSWPAICSRSSNGASRRCPPAWRPTAEVPTALADTLGVWHWGNTPYVVPWTAASW